MIDFMIKNWEIVALLLGGGGIFGIKPFRHAFLRIVKVGVKVLLTEEMATEYLLDLARWLAKKTKTTKDDELLEKIAQEMLKGDK